MLTTQNIYGQQPKISTAAERMAKARAAKEAKRRATTTPAAPPSAGEVTPTALAPQTTERLKTILLELHTMFGYGAPRGHELVTEGLRLLEAQ